MDIIDLLKRDQQKIREILGNLQATFRNDERWRRVLLERLIDKVSTYFKTTEKLLYPALYTFNELRTSVNENLKHQRILEQNIVQLSVVDHASDHWDVALNTLQSTLEQYIAREAQMLFPKASALLPREQRLHMAKAMESTKEYAI